MIKITIGCLRTLMFEALERHVEEEIDELQSQPEYKDVDVFVSYKLDNDELEYNFVELQALARNAAKLRLKQKDISEAPPTDVAMVRNVLEKEIGFKYIARKPIKNVRGAMSNPHGTHPFACSGGGGSGFGSDWGGGPGAIGSGKAWNPEDKGNLSMGSKRKKP